MKKEDETLFFLKDGRPTDKTYRLIHVLDQRLQDNFGIKLEEAFPKMPRVIREVLRKVREQ